MNASNWTDIAAVMIALAALALSIIATIKADKASNELSKIQTETNRIWASTDSRIGELIAGQQTERERIEEGRRKQWAIKPTNSQHVWVLTNTGHPAYGLKVEAEIPAELDLIPGTGNAINTDEEIVIWLQSTDPEQFPPDQTFDPEIEECGVISRWVTLTWHRLADLSDQPQYVHLHLPYAGH